MMQALKAAWSFLSDLFWGLFWVAYWLFSIGMVCLLYMSMVSPHSAECLVETIFNVNVPSLLEVNCGERITPEE